LSFYGLLLGLSVAEVANGVVNAFGARQKIKLGLLTPSLAVFVFFDITSFWIYVWGIRESLVVNWGTMFGGLVVALTYYFAAGLVFPRQVVDWPDLNEHYRRHKRLVYGCIIVANFTMGTVAICLNPPTLDVSFWVGYLAYWPMLFVLPFSRSDKLDLALLWILIAGYAANPLLPSNWILE
jgi:hypothetical protein